MDFKYTSENSWSIDSYTNSWNSNDEFNVRRHRVINAIDAQLSISSICKEVVIGKKSLLDKIKWGFESLDGNICFIYIRYDVIFRQKTLWTL